MVGIPTAPRDSESVSRERLQANPSPVPVSQAPPSERFVYLPAAEGIIHEIISKLRHSSDLSDILQLAVERLVTVLNADRGLIWQVSGDHLAVSNEYSATKSNCFIGNQLGPEEAAAVMLEFLSYFPEDLGGGIIKVDDVRKDKHLAKVSSTLNSLMELGEVRARMVAQLRCRGMFSGFVELQQCTGPREWNTEEAAITESISEILSVVVRQSFDQRRIEDDAQKLKLINEIANLFRESRGLKSLDTLVTSVRMAADRMGFCESQIYLWEETDHRLKPQLVDRNDKPVTVDMVKNPFLEVFTTGKDQLINAKFSRKPDPYFEHDTALIVPLVSKGTRIGVLGLWKLVPEHPGIRPQDKDLALTVAVQLANVIRTEAALVQLEQQAITDHMTGLYNRRYFTAQLSREIDRFQRFGRPFSCILCDLDFLKHINDTYGHHYGDLAIKHIAKILQTTARDVDTVSRYGGEEFLILLPETGAPAARLAAERFCSTIRASEVEGVGVVTASLGVATFPDDASDKEALLHSADKAMYLAKHSGRNRVCSISDMATTTEVTDFGEESV